MSVIAAGVTRLVIFPIIALGVLIPLQIAMDYKLFLFLEAIMPTAVSLVVIGSYTTADNEFFSSIIFYTHLAAIFTIPLWLAVFRIFM